MRLKVNAPPLILLVDDSELIHSAVGKIIRKSGFRLIEAYDGAEGFRKAKELMPDLIICDIEMPNMNGYEMCKQIRETEATQNLPIILMSAYGAGSDIDRGYEVGANDFLPKPVDMNELLSRVEIILSKQNKQQ